MPKHRTHHFACERVLGRSYPNVDKVLDWPVRFLGSTHRRWFHSWWQAFIIGALVSQSFEGGVAGIIHSLVDMVCSLSKTVNLQRRLRNS